jgi:hypothetical protein
VKLYKCKACGTLYVKTRPLQSVCSIPCSLKVAREKTQKTIKEKDRQDKKAVREKLDAMKTKPELLKLAQIAFNAWIRERDADLPCVSCGRHHTGQYHAGHYLSTGARPELRFEPLNVWKQCSACNTHLHGNLINFRQELIRRIGQDKVDWLEGPHEGQKYTHDELRDLAASYRAKLRELKKGQ